MAGCWPTCRFPRYWILFRNARQIPPRRATDCNTQEKTAGGRWGILNKLLLLVKAKSKNDNVWVSFIKGLHRHAATIACLLCMKFDYDNNIINLESLDLDDFKHADVPHYKDPGYNQRACLLSILNGDTEAPMLTSLFTFQAYILKELDGDIQPIMYNLRAYSEWVSISKIDSARKTISKTLWSWLSDMMKYSTPTRRKSQDIRPQWLEKTDMFT